MIKRVNELEINDKISFFSDAGYQKPTFQIVLGYGAQDGDKVILDKVQLYDLKQMIIEYLAELGE